MDRLKIHLYSEYPLSETELEVILVDLSQSLSDDLNADLIKHWQSLMLETSEQEDISKLLLVKKLKSIESDSNVGHIILSPRENYLEDFLNNPYF